MAELEEPYVITEIRDSEGKVLASSPGFSCPVPASAYGKETTFHVTAWRNYYAYVTDKLAKLAEK